MMTAGEGDQTGDDIGGFIYELGLEAMRPAEVEGGIHGQGIQRR